jgi:tetratricopeptide (TPR) repeat protein
MNRSKIFVILAIILTLGGGYLLADYYSGLPEDLRAEFVGRQSCVECHQDQASLFHGSHHDLAMAIADETTVLANFNDQRLTRFGVTSRMYRDGDKYMVQTEGPDGQLHDYEVKYTFGVEPLQQYMVEIEPPAKSSSEEHSLGRIQVLRLSWDTRKNEWFYLQPPDVSEKLMPDDPLHWTGVTQNWNVSCAECHSTNLQRKFDVSANRFATTFTDIDVSCESCHGPGSLHEEVVANKGIFWDRHHGTGLPNLKTESNIAQVETCAPCHSRRTAVAEGFTAGCRFDEFYAVQTIQDPIYHVDGQIRDEDYVYGSFLQSKMYHKGIRCTDCHDPHSTRLKHDGNQVCTSCHQHSAGKYDSISHHFHQPGTEAALCINCHMPHTTYMDVDQRHDHSFRVPRPDLSVKTGTPNACTACHIDQTKLPADENRRPLKQYLDWIIAAETGDQAVAEELERVNREMLEAVNKWYPAEISPPKTQYYADLATGLSSQSAVLNRLARDATAPSIVRSSAILGTGNDLDSFENALKMVEDSDLQIRVAAVRRLTGFLSIFSERMRDAMERVLPLLSDSSKQVRLEAVTFAMSVPPGFRDQVASASQRTAFQNGLKEYETFLRLNQDRAGGQMMLGSFFEQTQRVDQAKRAYERAIEMNDSMAGPRSRLAGLIEQQANDAGSAGVARLTVAKRAATLRQEEHLLLKRDLKLSEGLPENHILHYRFAMSCLLQKEYSLAKEHLQECLEQAPDDENYLYAAAAVFAETGEPNQAKVFINRLLKIDPNNPTYQQLANELR